jgi:hypothetical protein
VREEAFEMRVDRREGFVEPYLAFPVELPDRAAQLQDALFEIVTFSRQSFKLL